MASEEMHVSLSTPSFRNDNNYMMYLEVIIHSAKDLQQPLFGTMKPFVSAFIAVPDTESKVSKKVTYKNDGPNPAWDFMMEFDLTDDVCRMAMNYRLFCEIKNHGWLSNTKIGLATVPLEELLAGARKKIHHQVVSGGKTKGEIIISHELKFKKIVPTALPNPTDTQETNGGILPSVLDGARMAASTAVFGVGVANLVSEIAPP